jgi:hypothetical protein
MRVRAILLGPGSMKPGTLDSGAVDTQNSPASTATLTDQVGSATAAPTLWTPKDGIAAKSYLMRTVYRRRDGALASGVGHAS